VVRQVVATGDNDAGGLERLGERKGVSGQGVGPFVQFLRRRGEG
jgi:hypothetical protein